jgi:hypothetical protein
MNDNEYTPPKVWTWDSESGGKWASINRPIAGPTPQSATRGASIEWPFGGQYT